MNIATQKLVLRLKGLGFNDETIKRQLERWNEQDEEKGKKEVKCASCNEKFRVQRQGHRYCSPECAQRAYYLRRKERERLRREQALSIV